MRHVTRALPLLALALASCAGANPPSVRASLNCSSIGDPSRGGTYAECVQQWTRTNETPGVVH